MALGLRLRRAGRLPGLVALLAAGCLLPLDGLLAALPRSRAEVQAFRSEYPCPATGRTRGACAGWQVDHIVPLCAGGQDKASNMHWLSVEDHRFKTLVDVRECRRLRRNAAAPAR
jgi:hypothetical protein